MKMNISDALLERKNLTEEIRRLKSIASTHFTETIPKDKTLEESAAEKGSNVILLQDIHGDIEHIESSLERLRERLLKTNIATTVEIDGKTISLALLKIKIDTLKSRLSHFMALRGRGSGSRVLLTTEDMEQQVQQMNDLELERMIKELERKKTEFQQVLDKKNASTALVE